MNPWKRRQFVGKVLRSQKWCFGRSVMQEFFQCAFLKCGRYLVLVVNLM